MTKKIKVTWYKTIEFNKFIEELKKWWDYMKRSLDKWYIIYLTK